MALEKDEVLNSQYWDSFYKQNRGHLPSQFCISVLTDTAPESVIVELGSGNGRDSHYFASQGRRTAAMDISAEAIKSCESYAAEAKIKTIQERAEEDKQALEAQIRGKEGEIQQKFQAAMRDKQERMEQDHQDEIR